jgi:hypothetical protein
MSDSPIRVAIKGLNEAKAELRQIAAEGDLATKAAVNASTALVARSIKSRMRGKPRWNHRGASKRTGAEVNITGPVNSPRAGGPGVFTGTLAKGVRKSRRPRKAPGGFSGAVIMGSKDTKIRNIYKGVTEERFPFWRPGVAAATPKVDAVWTKAWKRVIDKHR